VEGARLDRTVLIVVGADAVQDGVASWSRGVLLL
jgi:hypothetical protein